MSVTDRFSSAVIAGALYGSKFCGSGTPKTVSLTLVASLRNRGGFYFATASDARVIGLRRDTSLILFASTAAPRSPLKWAAFCAAPSQPTTDANAGRGRGVVFA